MTTELVTVTFKDVPIGALYMYPDGDVAKKTGITTAVDDTCPPDMCFTEYPNTQVLIERPGKE